MENRDERVKKQKNIERIVLGLCLLYNIAMSIIVIRNGWPIWIVAIINIGWGASLLTHIGGYRDYRFRAYFMVAMMQAGLVLYGMSVPDLISIWPSVISMVVFLGLFGIPELIGITAATSTFLIYYHLFVQKSLRAATPDATTQLMFQVLSIYFVQYIMYYLVKKQLEGNKRQEHTIRSLQEAERSKDDFLSNVSHEIRTPINTICGMSEIVLREELSDSVREDVFSIQTAGRNLLSIVSDVLDFSELQSDKLALVEESYNITSTINDVINMSLARVSEKNIELIVDCNANIPSGLMGDEQKIRRVIMNLVNNAAKFTEEGFVSIIIFSRPTTYGINLTVRVKDTGIGMRAESQEKLFSSFNQVDTRRNRQEGGIGLGLAISQAIVDAMGGFISVHSEIGKGSEIQFVIPQRIKDDTPIASVHNPERLHVLVYADMDQFELEGLRNEYNLCIQHMVEQLGVRTHVCQNFAELKRRVEREVYTHVFISYSEYEQEKKYFDRLAALTTLVVIAQRGRHNKIGNPDIRMIYKPLFVLPVVMMLNGEKVVQGIDENYFHHGRFIAPKAHVLAVDDNLMNIRVLEGLLRPYQIKVSMAMSGMEALRKIETMDYDFIFMDHMMPEMDGIETLHRIRKKPGSYYKKVPVVALTANAIGGMREVFLAEGFQDFVAKPIELSVLERVLKRNLPPEKLVHIEEDTLPEQGETPEKTLGTNGDLDLPAESFDVSMGMSYCGGRENYIQILQLNAKNGAQDMEKIRRYFAQADWKNYTIVVHALKSSMKSIGVMHLSELAKELERAGKQGDEAYIRAHNEELLAEYARITGLISASSVISPKDSVQKDGGENELDSDAFAAYLPKLEDAAYSFNEERMLALVRELSAYSYRGRTLQEELEPIVHKIEMTDYISASEAVAGIKERLDRQ